MSLYSVGLVSVKWTLSLLHANSAKSVCCAVFYAYGNDVINFYIQFNCVGTYVHVKSLFQIMYLDRYE